jgi:hypothetical protein
MSRRVSAGELEQRHKLKHLLLDFTDEMSDAMYENLEEKGFSWKSCSIKHLKKKLLEHAKVGDWVAVANFAFMLHDKETTT